MQCCCECAYSKDIRSISQSERLRSILTTQLLFRAEKSHNFQKQVQHQYIVFILQILSRTQLPLSVARGSKVYKFQG